MIDFYDYKNLYKHVFEPIKVGPLVLKNRLQFAPLVCNMVTSSGKVTRDFIDFIDMQASTGAAVVTIGASPVDLDSGADASCELDITNDDNICGLTLLAEAAHIHGAKLSIELLHAGRAADPALLRLPEALSASPMPVEGRPRYVKQMDQREIDHVISCFADCTRRLKRCGFDMVLVHAGHSNLLAQFLSPVTNKRTDNYGGSFENRARFPLEVLKAVKEAAGTDMAVDMRISGDEHVPGGMQIEDTSRFIIMAQEYIDIVHVSAGWIADRRAQFYTMPPYYRPYGCNVPLARAVKQNTSIHIPVVTVGSIKTLEMVETIISEGSADCVAMARALLSDPELVKKSCAGHPENVRPCLRCWDCNTAGHIRCTVNPSLGRTGIYADPQPAKKKKKICVVGGGPSGMTAARTLAERGHDVILFEKSGSLGGLLNEISSLVFKDDLREYTRWAVRETMGCGADIRLNSCATKALLEQECPDTVVLASGGIIANPEIPGINEPFVISVLDADNKRRIPGARVVVCGGGASGLECALSLSMEGRIVTVIDKLPVEQFGSGMAAITRSMLLTLLQDNNVSLIGETSVESFSDGVLTLRDGTWHTSHIHADNAVISFGLLRGIDSVRDMCAIAPETIVVGDCAQPGRLFDANNGAYCRCVHV